MSDISKIKDINGTTYDIKDAVARPNLIWYGTCSTGASTQTKVVSITGIAALAAGLHISVKFDNAQTYNGQPKINLNSLGAKSIVWGGYIGGYVDMWSAGATVDFVYDGTNWQMCGDVPFPSRTLTLEQYNALSTADKNKDIIYIVTDDYSNVNYVEQTTYTTGMAGKQDKITASGVLIGAGSGSVSSKTLDSSSLTNDNNHIPTSGVVKSALSPLRAVQISDDNVFSNSFALFYDWTNYLKTKAGTGTNYCAVIRLPSPDSDAIFLVAFPNGSEAIYRYKVSMSTSTITYIGTNS